MARECLRSSTIRFCLSRPRMRSKNTSSRIVLRICRRNWEKKMILNWKRQSLRLLPGLLTLPLLLQVSSLIQLPYWNWDSKNGPTIIKKRRTWWICILEMSILLKTLSLRFNSKQVLDPLRKSSQLSSRQMSRIIPYTTTLTRSTLRLIWLRNKTSKSKKKFKDMRSLESSLRRKKKMCVTSLPNKLKKVTHLPRRKTTRLKILRLN